MTQSKTLSTGVLVRDPASSNAHVNIVNIDPAGSQTVTVEILDWGVDQLWSNPTPIPVIPSGAVTIGPDTHQSFIALITQSTAQPSIALSVYEIRITIPNGRQLVVNCFALDANGKVVEANTMLHDQLVEVGSSTTACCCVNSIAELRGLNPGTVSCLTVLGYFAAGDGGGGDFYWEAGVTTGDDGGTIIVPSASPTGRWRRIYSSPLNVKWFGAKGDGSTNDHDAIQNAIDASHASSARAGAVYFPGGTPDVRPTTGAYLSTALSIVSPTVLIGDGRDQSSLIFSSASTTPFLTSIATLELRSLRFDGACGPNSDLILFQGDTGNLVMEDCCILDPKANGVHAVRLNTEMTIRGCDFRFRTSGAYPNVLLFVEYSTVDGGTLSVSNCTFINPSVPSSPGPGAILLQGMPPTSSGGTTGLSANISHNYFYQVGTNGTDGHPLGCVDIYNWVGRTVIHGNRMHKPTFCAVKIANSAGVIITDNVVTEVTTSFGAAAIFFAGNIPHPGPSGGPFHNILVANNIVRNYASGPGIEVHGDTTGTSLRHEIVGNIVDGATSGIQLDGALNVLIADNVICNSTGNTNYDGGIRMVRMVASSPDQGEVTIRGCMFINNGAYAIFADGNYDNSGLRLSVSDCLFYSSNVAPLLCLTHIRLGSSVASIVQADIRDNRLRGNPQALIITGNPDKLWLYDNQAETSTISIGPPVNGLLHGGNSWDVGTAGWTISLANLGSQTAPVIVTGANPGDTVVVGYDGFPAGILGGGVVTTAGLAEVTLFNTGTPFGSTAGNVRVAVSRHL